MGPRHNENIDLFNELKQILLNALRKQAFSVLLLVIACWVLGYVVWEQKTAQEAQMLETKEALRSLQERLDACDKSRQELAIEFYVLRGKYEVLQEEMARIKKRR